jgi:hypothetical protein
VSPADGDTDNTPKVIVMLMIAANVVVLAALCVQLCVLLTRTDSDV